MLTKFYADVHGLNVINGRIGWYMSKDDLRETIGEDLKPRKA
ncbi:hypothetical protein [Halocatena halophila]